MNDLADLYTSVGGDTAANEIRKQGDFTQKVVVSLAIISQFYFFLFLFFLQANINKLGDLNIVTLDCNTPGSSQLVANTMDDLAGIIEDVGMENLCKQLDLEPADCTFQFLSNESYARICMVKINQKTYHLCTRRITSEIQFLK